MHPLKIAALELENRMTEFFKLDCLEISEQYFKAAMLIYGMMSEKEYNLG